MRPFYNFPDSLKVRLQLIEDAQKIAINVLVDELDCSKSFMRQPTDKTVDEVVDLIKKDRGSHWTFSIEDARYGEEEHGRIAICTMCKRPDYFLWIKLSVDNAYQLIDKYKLKQLQ